ncbi:uncharacterized protein LOC106638619 [Copidosoma floridanum]|uniref:uncharacterized protein LOC106638619 n=1 Tax=Copidosoma floridanum TaxID=29053 RepID=UPI0006C97DE0|nr:uncharacterized protein LOC106638619 [Copidosoma floridanum]
MKSMQLGKGRTFKKIIQDFVETYGPLNDTYLAQYETPGGRRVYDETLACVMEQYPQYVREIEGTADGSEVPFYKLFLMHLDDIIVPPETNGEVMRNGKNPVGCSSIICNQPGQEILGHNEDALSETLNHWYLVDAHIVEAGLAEEKFCSLSYAGFLPGYTMGYNHHGLVYSVNTLSAEHLCSGKTPRYFLARALLAADSGECAEEVLRNEGYGAAEGFSVNMTFVNDASFYSDRVFKNIEIGPAEPNDTSSRLDISEARPGDYLYHCNKYMRLKVPEVVGCIIDSSIHRMEAINRHDQPKTLQDVIDVLSDQTDDDYRVYQEIHPDDYVKTIATGIFDCIERTWSIYTDKPSSSKPIVVLPIRTKTSKIEDFKN